MDNPCGQENPFKHRERGASRLKFILIIAVLAVIAYAGYLYVPVAYQASRFKVAMQDNVDKAATLGQSNEWLRGQLRMDGNELGVPQDAEMTIERSGEGRVQVRVQYKRAIAFPGYTYAYNFDHTARSTQLLGSKQ